VIEQGDERIVDQVLGILDRDVQGGQQPAQLRTRGLEQIQDLGRSRLGNARWRLHGRMLVGESSASS
jgi:hypothetical protein